MADYKAWQVLRRHLLGLTWPPAPRLTDEELKKLTKHNSDAPSPSSLLDAAEAARWNAEEGKVSTLIQSASPGLNAPNPTDATVVDVIRISVLYEYIGKLEEANISLSRASKTLAKVQNASPVLQLFIDVASLILSVKQDALQELRVKQLGVCGALGKLPKGVPAGIAHALVADFFLTLGKWNEAESLYGQAIPLLGQDTAAGDAHLALARGKLVEANASLETIHSTLKDQASTSVRNWTGVVAARIAQAQGRFGDAQQLMEQALAQLKSGPEGHSLAYSFNALILICSSAVIEAATLAVQRGELLKADELLASVASLRRDSAASPLALSYVLALVSLRMRQSAIKEAETVLVEKLTEQKNRKGATAEFLVAAPLLHSLACVYADSGRVEDAEGLVSDTLAMRRKVLSEDHIGLLADLQLHARILLLTGHDPAADALWTRVIAIATKSGSSFLLGSVYTALGQAHAQRGNVDKAEAALRQGHAARLKAAGNAPCAFLAESGVLLAECDLARERLATAKELARAAVQAAKAAGAVELEGSALLCLSRALSDHEFTERESTAERAWTLRRERQGPAAPRTVEALLALVSAYDLQGKMEEATALLQFALRALKKEHPEMDDPMMVHVTHQLALHYWDMEQSEEAVALATQSVELSKRVFGASHPLTAAVLDGAALIFDDADMGGEADEAKQAAAAIRAQHGAQP